MQDLALAIKKLDVPSKTNPLICIVDDDESVRDAIAGLMKFLGYRVHAFGSAAELLASSDVAETSCLITDIQMPQMTGIELHKRLDELGYIIPTIMITAYPDTTIRDRVLAEGAFSYLSKPFDNDALIDCVRDALDLLSE